MARKNYRDIENCTRKILLKKKRKADLSKRDKKSWREKSQSKFLRENPQRKRMILSSFSVSFAAKNLNTPQFSNMWETPNFARISMVQNFKRFRKDLVELEKTSTGRKMGQRKNYKSKEKNTVLTQT